MFVGFEVRPLLRVPSVQRGGTEIAHQHEHGWNGVAPVEAFEDHFQTRKRGGFIQPHVADHYEHVARADRFGFHQPFHIRRAQPAGAEEIAMRGRVGGFFPRFARGEPQRPR